MARKTNRSRRAATHGQRGSALPGRRSAPHRTAPHRPAPPLPSLQAPKCRFSACPKKWPWGRRCWVSPLPRVCLQLTADHPHGRMMVSSEEAQLMANLAKLIKAKKVIEIGVFTGYNALSMALVLPDDGRVIACDINEDYAKIGRPLWKEAGVEHKIDLRIKPAIQTLDELLASGEAETFDFAFIDADKESYNEYYEKCLHLIKKGGIIAIDNVFWNGKVLKPRKDDLAAQSIHRLNEKLLRDARVNISMLPVGDGVTLAFKL
ncbi:catechol O-methyltransferase domain-containing protein 1 isoform X1 [Serinus canaria]|uniref:catechol O-methyltransferase domain-containing protein 1 isoform X1 n=1 Tax=Serinus canaria TaxID=9135 RepID=UPI0021CC7A04|nr:catechol O-methyltransferase domain-containing protein 1 isoform X1 [Serinus canaria]